jgi:ABC-2 type transport system ATP-binding protein
MKAAAETRQLTKYFNDFWGRRKITAVRDVTLDIPTGCIFGLLGPNGSGKSTTLKLLTGLLHPSHGTVAILGGSPHSQDIRRRLGFLPESFSPYPHLSARETLLFYAGLFGIPGQEARRNTAELLEMTGLQQAADRPVGEISKGMNRRVGLAQALINNPDLLILDEPTSGLDPAGCILVKDMLRAHASRGKTVIVSSHLLADIEHICDSVCILHNGAMIATGTLDSLLERQEQVRFTTDAVTDSQRLSLQDAFRTVTGREADVDHPRMALDIFFARAVKEADHSGENA